MECLKIKKPVRSYSGEMWRTNYSNKQRLVLDFDHRCAYCDDYDKYSGGYNAYHVEHFAPKEKFKKLEFVYDNLLYCCPYCNSSKSNKWEGRTAEENIVDGKGFVDPCSDEYYLHLGRDTDGNIVYKSSIGKYIYEELKLYLKRHAILYNLEKIRIKKNQLKSKIAERKKLFQDNTDIEELYAQLCIVFCEYYDLLFEDGEE